MTTLNIRIDEKLKNNAADVLQHMGLDLSSAIKMFLNQVVVKKGIPFTPTIVDEFGDVGYNTLIDFTEIDKDGVPAKDILEAFKEMRKK
jgi:DNA-damage-inducible protein J